MSKLAARLGDASRSGVYRASRADAVEEAVPSTRLSLARVALHGAKTKEALLEAIAASLAFPHWFGANWDALEDCLSDLSWLPASGYVLVIEHAQPGDDLGVLIDVLRSAAEWWSERGKPFVAVFVDPARRLQLPQLP